jgi:hypothetical protein
VIIAGPRGAQLAFDAAGLSGRLPFVDGARSMSYAPGLRPPGKCAGHEQCV